MSQFSTPAILIRRAEYGDYDLIVTVFSLAKGKVSLIAKGAKKSSKRFAGVLELFSEIDIVGSSGRNRGLPVLQEAALRRPFPGIRTALSKTAYASFWAELVNHWMEEHVEHPELFYLLQHVLGELDRGALPEGALSVFFMVRFLNITGHSPNLDHCTVCRCGLDTLPTQALGVEISRGGVACPECRPCHADALRLSKGTIKQLQWIAAGDLNRAVRMKLSAGAVRESLEFLECFLPYHLGRQPRSLKILRQLRSQPGPTP
jgi:DNA repair protein RecO (recombination protein O)